jgi:maltose O-acetyltransferase
MRRASRKFMSIIVNSVLASVLVPVELRVWALRRCGMTLGVHAQVRAQCYVMTPSNVTLGDGAFVNNRCFLESHAPIVIGARTSLAMEVLLCTSSHHIGDAQARGGPSFIAPIEIGEGCWLGARCTVLPGVTIGDSCVIASGALVTSDCEPNGVYAGVPAKRLRDLEQDAPAR